MNQSLPSYHASPLALNQRYITLDVLRGAALLGILMMNIIAFAFPDEVYNNPMAMGVLDTAGVVQWTFSEVFFAEKFYTLFAGLFGAGIVLMAERQADPLQAKNIHYRRMLWLLLIGLLHAYGMWWGDILVTYAVGGMLVFTCRKWSVRRLVTVSLLLQAMLALLMMSVYWSWEAFDEADKLDIYHYIWPTAESIHAEISAYTGSWWERSAMRVSTTFEFQVSAIFAMELRMCGIMMLGMALYKSGWLTGSQSLLFYQVNAVAGIVLGTIASSIGAALLLTHNFAVPGVNSVYEMPNYWGALPLSWGYVCTLIMLVKIAKAGGGLRHKTVNWLANVGRMALSNYLLQTVLCTALFYGWGFGLFGQLERPVLTLIVLIVWAVQIGLSQWWLARFAMGPMERIWRNLTYRHWQPLLQKNEANRHPEPS